MILRYSWHLRKILFFWIWWCLWYLSFLKICNRLWFSLNKIHFWTWFCTSLYFSSIYKEGSPNCISFRPPQNLIWLCPAHSKCSVSVGNFWIGPLTPARLQSTSSPSSHHGTQHLLPILQYKPVCRGWYTGRYKVNAGSVPATHLTMLPEGRLPGKDVSDLSGLPVPSASLLKRTCLRRNLCWVQWQPQPGFPSFFTFYLMDKEERSLVVLNWTLSMNLSILRGAREHPGGLGESGTFGIPSPLISVQPEHLWI